MTCLVCKNAFPTHNNKECFVLILDNLKLHYTHMNNKLEQRNYEIQRLQQHNEKLNQLVHLSQPKENVKERVKEDQQNTPDQVSNKINLSGSDDDTTFDPNLNIALNSDQLFDTSVLSPLTTNLHTSSDLIMSPHVKITPKRNKQQDIPRTLNDKNSQASKRCNSFRAEMERAKTRSWATNFLHSNGSSIKEDEVDRRPDKKLCLSLKKQNNFKLKQTIMEDYAKQKLSESTFCDEIIEASPAMEKTTLKTSKSSLLQRNDNFSISEPDVNGSNAKKKIKNTEPIVSIDQIVFDFSPTKKMDMSVTNKNSPININSTPTHTKKCFEVRESYKDLIDSPYSSNLNNSSVIMLTPSTQDIIFIDDVTDENSTNINTMDLVRELKQSGTSTLKNFYSYESKCILKQSNKDIAKNLNANQTTSNKNEQQFQMPKPGGYIKVEKITQSNNINNVAGKQNSNDGVMQWDNCVENDQSKKQDDDDDDGDCMPRPIQIKEEVKGNLKKINIKEQYNIDCQKCEQYIQFFASHLTISEIEDHLSKCPVHNRQYLNRTPEGFWNPHILSFPADDARNKVLFDRRLKDKKAVP